MANEPDKVPEMHELGLAKRDFTQFPGVMALDDIDLSVDELMPLVRAGGKTLLIRRRSG